MGNENRKVLKKQKKKSGNFTIPGILPTFFHSKLKSKKVSINLSFNFSKNLVQRYYNFLI